MENNRYNEVDNNLVIVHIGGDHSGSMKDKWDQVIKAYSILRSSILADDSLLSSALLSYSIFGNTVGLIQPLDTADHEIDLEKYRPTNEGTAYYEHRSRVEKYLLQCVREAQKAGKTVKYVLEIELTDGMPTDPYNQLEAKRTKEKADKVGFDTMALAIGDDCNIDLLKKYNNHVFKVEDADKIAQFFKDVVVTTIKAVSQSIVGDQFATQYVQGVAETKEVTQEDLDDVKDIDDPPFMQLK